MVIYGAAADRRTRVNLRDERIACQSSLHAERADKLAWTI